MGIIAKKIKITGLVQGVGFRPFIFKHALKYGVCGWVENRNDGVMIHAEADPKILDCFISTIPESAPLASSISSMSEDLSTVENFKDFVIKKSESISNEVTEISPDIAVCDDCLEDMRTQKNRIGYPFTNCTNCGPRFTIIKDLPYDRQKTTMEPFKMCAACEKEYTDIMDRRFHAQPVACNNCGPVYTIHYNNIEITDFEKICELTPQLIDEGKIVSIKGMGGFFMACDALNEEAVARLRNAKKRDMKPFAVMVSSIKSARKYANINDVEEKSLTSWRRPIVLLETKLNLAEGVCSGFDRTGIMLPYMPFHHILFSRMKTDVIVLTSGNISDEPIIISNDEAIKKLLPVSDALLTYNREIYNRADDSVEIYINGNQRLIRRSRGYTPNPINLKFDVEGIFAAGAELVNCFCIGKKNQAFMSQHIGDIKDWRTYEFYTESVERFKQMFRLNIHTVVHDLHPEYFSTKFALEYGVESIAVQHHHAHIASCMAEHELDEEVIGVAMDGTGLGTDSKIWGAEFFVCDYNNFRRISHFDYIPLPGGDKVTEEPWRTAVSMLYKYYGNEFRNLNLDFLKKIPNNKLNTIISAIDNKLNCPESSSAGRLFDAVSALTNICPVSGFHAEAPMRLEAAIEQKSDKKYEVEIGEIISFRKTIEGIVNDLLNNVSKSEIAVKFHNTVVYVILKSAENIRQNTGLNKVVMSGGSFQNAYLLAKSEQLLSEKGFVVYSPNKIPANDGGLALGQLAIAAKRKHK
ncbi:MAG: carbamoyltransferase HypF [Bacteroidales bacterium]|nr:carbamoyltransferase HypF [Bacteroidales bacterium]HQP03352.1 carbamoyltransferase HypF [Bacteroidales bacterium]